MKKSKKQSKLNLSKIKSYKLESVSNTRKNTERKQTRKTHMKFTNLNGNYNIFMKHHCITKNKLDV